MGESDLHRIMKAAAALELSSQGYSICLEPLWPPHGISWESYRPDVFGIRRTASRQDFALVECETRPSTRKLLHKNYGTIELQDRLDLDSTLRRVIVIPRGTLDRLATSIRFSWETWIFGGSFLKLPLAASQGRSHPNRNDVIACPETTYTREPPAVGDVKCGTGPRLA